MVREGRITRAGDTQARLLRDNVVIYEGKISSLAPCSRRVERGQVGLRVAASASTSFNDVKVGDMIEVFAMERVLTPRVSGSGFQTRARRRTSDPRGSGVDAPPATSTIPASAS